MQSFIQAHGGVLAIAGVGLVCFNITMTAVKSVFDTLKAQEPVWLQKLGTWGSAASGWISANTTPKPPQS